MWKTFGLLFLVALFTGTCFAQEVKVVKFDKVQQYLVSTSDTLYVLNFWATWCKPCVEELPFFEKLNQEYKEKKVKVILISLDFQSKLQERVIPFLKVRKLASEVWLLNEPDYNAWIDKVNANWSGSIPATVFIRGSENVRQFYEQSFEEAQLKETVEKIIQP